MGLAKEEGVKEEEKWWWLGPRGQKGEGEKKKKKEREIAVFLLFFVLWNIQSCSFFQGCSFFFFFFFLFSIKVS